MLFNSDVFLKFFAAFLLLYWLVRENLAARNVLIVAASYLFYGWWDWRFLSLIFVSSVLDYGIGLALARTEDPRRRRIWLWLSVGCSLVILGFFKYYDFFVESLGALLAHWQIPFHPRLLGVILPVGISFYTFQSMSYVIDIYRRQMKPTPNLVNFLAYVAFFPQLVAGPIERASHLLPQFERTVTITRAMLEEGVWLVLWGMFKKVVVADNLAPLVEMVYGHMGATGPAVVLATLAFGVQIYCDFSGYSDMARGTARVLGFDIMVNFNLPYVAVNIREFWQRWHISLSTWLRDYLYIPLGGSQRGAARTYLNLLVTMLLGGLWHGAAGNFVLWGLWHGGGLMGHRLWTSSGQVRRGTAKWARGAAWLLTLLFVFYGWLLFRAGSWHEIAVMTRALADATVPPWIGSFALNLVAFTAPLIAVETWLHQTRDPLAPLALPVSRRILLQGTLLLAIALFWETRQQPFIYFQF
ncbi:MAG: MBOAT family protein [Verrucomicrobia bacterium]|nr:MBOAT family protein [Verrucomicrobiota bacterium]